jgi:hypothetical protein
MKIKIIIINQKIKMLKIIIWTTKIIKIIKIIVNKLIKIREKI